MRSDPRSPARGPFTRYTDNGLLEIDNSAAGRALRAVALGRTNYLFAGSDSGGERAAAMYTLIGSAKLNGLDPELYLRTVLARIADQPSQPDPEPHALEPGTLTANPCSPSVSGRSSPGSLGQIARNA